MKTSKPIGAIAVTSKAVFKLPCAGNTAAAGMHKVLGYFAGHLCWVAAELCEHQKTHGCNCSDKQVQNFIGVTALASTLFLACLTEQHWCSGLEHGARLECGESVLECSRIVSSAKISYM